MKDARRKEVRLGKRQRSAVRCTVHAALLSELLSSPMPVLRVDMRRQSVRITVNDAGKRGAHSARNQSLTSTALRH